MHLLKKKSFSPLFKIKKKIHPLAYEGHKSLKKFSKLPLKYLHTYTKL